MYDSSSSRVQSLDYNFNPAFLLWCYATYVGLPRGLWLRRTRTAEVSRATILSNISWS
jgi:hypothetical protein